MGVSQQISPVDFKNSSSLLTFVSLYRALHDRSEGKECLCGVCRMVRGSGIELLDLDNAMGATVEEQLRALESAKHDTST